MIKIKRKSNFNSINILFLIFIILSIISILLYYKYNKSSSDNNLNRNKIVLSKNTNLRTGPGNNYPSIKSLSSSERLVKYAEVDDWIEVKTSDNFLGWIEGWNVFSSNIKDPKEKLKEKLSNYSVLLNSESKDDFDTYILSKVKENLEKDGIKVIQKNIEKNNLNKEEYNKLLQDNNINIEINVDVYDDKSINSGVTICYEEDKSKILANNVKKYFDENYIYKVNNSKKISSKQILGKEIPKLYLYIGNVSKDIDIDILKNKVYSYQYVLSITRGIEDYFYDLINQNMINENNKEKLINAPHKGMDIPLYYTKQEEYKDISYGLDGDKNIKSNGDVIISLIMIQNYLYPDKKITVNDIVNWSGNKYYVQGKGNSDKIIEDFCKKNSIKYRNIKSDIFKNIDESLKEGKPVIVKLKKGSFSENKESYKVIRGKEDNKYYFNDPNDDEIKLNSYKGFSKESFEKDIINIWELEK